ncbi:unnamed protein product [Brachionus calyciflorus]|uniref:Protein UNC80 central region domain-containing protein n=1 Tax=Brachionus calyciflorus TaxID=104777 RepID=A0A814KYH6_9BILA|nr:unnamed protein product [Brachionus calyciflorus]
MKENHGNIFRKIALSNMLDSYIKINQETQIKNLKLIEIDDKLKELDKLKQIISNHVAIKPEMAHLIEEENPHRIMKSNLENDSKRSSFRHRTTKIGSKNNLDSDQNDSTQILNDNLIPLENLSSRRGSEASFRRMKKLKEHKKPSFSIADDQEMTGSKLDEDSVKVKKDLNVLFTTDIEILNNLYEQTLAYRRKIQSEKIFINSRIVFKGLEYYRFLMECLPPASLPDVPFMSALLELEAPVLSKASFLIETAYFVNRCNKKDWPEWIKMNISMCRPYGSFFNNKNLPNTLKRNKVFQLAAANIFSAWGEVLAIKLEAILNERKNNLCENDMKPEDFFDDSKFNFLILFSKNMLTFSKIDIKN